MTAAVIGIDPGLTGAIAVLREGAEPWVRDMPVAVHGKGFVKQAVALEALADLLEPWSYYTEVSAYLERVNAFPGQGVGSMFSLGMSFWGAAGVLAGLGIRVKLVPPQEWKAHFRLDKDKERSRALAARLFPSADLARKKHHGRAEALLIARWGQESQS